MKDHKQDIIDLIKKEIAKHETNESYYGSRESEVNEIFVLNLMKEHLGYDFENDGEMQEKFLYDGLAEKATPVDALKYYLDNIIPKL